MSSSHHSNGSGPNLTKAEYLLFVELIEKASGLRFEERDWTPLRAAVCERVDAAGSSSFGEYYELLRSSKGAAELNRLIELLTVHETAFFRNPGHFQILSRRIIPELLDRKGSSRTLRVWSAGCSTGQEAYSIAISLLEAIPDAANWEIDVLATDISYPALDRARSGIYPGRTGRNVDPALLDRYFHPWEGGYRVADRVRQLVRFEYLNLVKEPFPLAALSPVDVIFCENVTIYFKIESTRRVIRNFYETLSDGGYLFLGYSETLWQISNDFKLKEIDGTFVYRKVLESEETAHEGVAGNEVAIPGSLVTPPVPERTPSRSLKVGKAASRPLRKVATLEEALAFYEARRFEEALLAVESLLSAAPGDAETHLLAAKLRADREEVGPALVHCRRALDLDPLLEEGHYLTGVLLMRAGDNMGAAESLAKVIYLNPVGQRSALAHFHLAGLRADNRERDAAAREYRAALRLFERLPKEELVEEFSADFLARVCRRRLEEMGRG